MRGGAICKECISSWPRRILSIILQPGTKTTCEGDTREEINLDMRVTRIFTATLYIVLARLMRRKC